MGLTGWYVSQTQEQTDGQELTVVTSFYPMYIAAENVIGDADGVRLENLSETLRVWICRISVSRRPAACMISS